MNQVSRRGVLGGVAAVLAAARFHALVDLPAAAATPLPSDPFTLGVASGDPLPDSVVLWTRLAPDPANGGGMPPGDVAVAWQAATDAAFTDIVAQGTEPAVAALAHSVHVTASGLDPDRWYHYRFSVEGYTSPTGRTRTTPAASASTPLRLGAACCQNWRAGYYTAYAHLAEEGCDLIVFLGDYIYESGGSGPVRDHSPTEAATLEQYRNRYALYKGDVNLQAAHAACPWLVTWDDHEVADNYAGTTAKLAAGQPTFLERRAVAYQAWYEHQAVRLDPPSGPDFLIYRRLEWGAIARLHLPDTRQYRSDQACGDGLQLPCTGYDDAGRTLLGAEQEAWLLDSFATSTKVWDVFAQQIVFAPMRIGKRFNMDQWDGYPAQRARIWPALQATTNPVVLSGDIHFGGIAGLNEVLEDAASPRRAIEVVAGSISSTFGTTSPALVKVIIEAIPWWDHINAADRGYAVIDLDATSMHVELRVVSTALQPTATIRTDYALDATARPVPVQPEPTTSTSTTSTSTTTPASTSSTTTPATSTSTSTTATPARVAADATAAPPATPVVATPGFTG